MIKGTIKVIIIGLGILVLCGFADNFLPSPASVAFHMGQVEISYGMAVLIGLFFIGYWAFRKGK